MEQSVRKKVLIVEDDPSICDALEDVLENEQFLVETISTFQEAFKTIEMFDPDIVLIDYILPEINGGELCHQLKTNARTSHIPVIMYSGYPKVLLSLGNYGWDEFIEKPFDIRELLEKIHLCISRSQQLHEKHS